MPDTECAWLEVPVDHARPDGPQLTLRLGRVPVLDPAQRQGALLLIPGGPGAGISEMLAGAWGMRSAHHVDEFRQHYDVVTFDPRGIGQSNPIRCDPDLVPPVTPPQDQRTLGRRIRGAGRRPTPRSTRAASRRRAN